MLNISFHHFAPFSSRAGIAAPLRSAAPLGAANARTSQKRRSLCRLPAAKDFNRNSPRHAHSHSVADFAASRRQINLIHRGGRSPSRHSDSRALQARQSCRFLETDSLYPPQAALRRFPCASAAILRSARHGECRALKIPLKAASRLEWALKGAAAPLL